jgi:hypothetical protein
MSDDDPEGAFNLVGSADDPQLEEADLELGEADLELEEEQDGEDERVEVGGREFAKEEVDLAHDTLEKVREVTERVRRVVNPLNVVVASIIMVFLVFSAFAIVFWAIPRDAVDVDVVYMQSGPGHVVLVELHNYGTKPIAEVTVVITFTDMEGEVLNSTRFYRDQIASHTSIAGDDLELIISGVTVWAEYDITIELEYSYYGGSDLNEEWVHRVGDWTSEMFTDKADRHWL